MAQPPGFRDIALPDHVCLLCKSLYGLKQSPRCWFQKIQEVLYSFGLIDSRVNPSVFISKQGALDFHLCIYVVDIIIASADDQELKRLLIILSGEFPIRDLGDLRFFFGIQVSRTEAGLHLSRTQYLSNLLQSAEMTNLKPAVTPMFPSLDLRPRKTPISNPRE